MALLKCYSGNVMYNSLKGIILNQVFARRLRNDATLLIAEGMSQDCGVAIRFIDYTNTVVRVPKNEESILKGSGIVAMTLRAARVVAGGFVMAGTSEGNKKGYQTTTKKLGKRFIKERAIKGGSVTGVVKGYAKRRDLASENGRKGALKRWANQRAK